MAIISHKHKFIFIKTRKTAGTSIEIALSRYCGPDDILSPISSVDEEKRRDLGYPQAQNYVVPFGKYRPKDWARLLLKRKRAAFRNHMWARDIQRLVGREVWDGYYKFCFERDPWDKAISAYYWASRKKMENRSLEDFLLQGGFNHFRSYEQYVVNGNQAVDDIYRYESMPEALVQIAQRVGLPGPLELPQTKAGHRKDRRPYHEVLSPAAAERIGRDCAPEIRLMGYEYVSESGE